MTFDVPREEVWAAITEPDQISKWFGTKTELELRAGAKGVFRWDETVVPFTVEEVDASATVLVPLGAGHRAGGRADDARRVHARGVAATGRCSRSSRPASRAARRGAARQRAGLGRGAGAPPGLPREGTGLTRRSDDAKAGAVFAALADPTRREIATLLSERGPLTQTELAARLPISRQGVAKHLAALADAGLVESTRDGREARFRLTPRALRGRGALDDGARRALGRAAGGASGAARAPLESAAVDLYEYQGKELFKRFGISVSEGRLATTPDEARAAAEELGGQVVVKAQVLTGGRGKAGGIKLADDPDDASAKAGADPRAGHPRPRRPQALDRDAPPRSRRSTTSRSPSTAARSSRSSCSRRRAGSTSRRSPRSTRRRSCACTSTRSRASSRGRRADSSTGRASTTRTSRSRSSRWSRSSTRRSSRPTRCSREINPLIVTPEGEVKALDSKFTVDDSALFRHPDIAEMRDLDAVPPEERAAREKDVTYVKLDGEVGILGNGAGLVMSTLDVIAHAGGRPANFCDLGGGGDAQGVVDALEVITADPQVKSIFFNIFGGITRCDEVARGILAGARADGDRGPDRRPPRRHERRGGAQDPRRGVAAEPPRGADDARRRPARGGARGVTDVWSERAEAFRQSATHREGPDLDLVVDWCEPGEGVNALDVATGGGHVARRLREAGCDVVSVDPAPGMQPTVVARAEDIPFADDSFDVVACRIAPHHFEDVRAAIAEMARVSRDRRRGPGQPLPERGGRAGGAAARPDARAQLLRARSGARSSPTQACGSRRSGSSSGTSTLEPGSRASRRRPTTPRASASCSTTGSRTATSRSARSCSRARKLG